MRRTSSSPSQAHTPLLRTTALVGAMALVSRVLGFVRDMAMAWLLGNSLAADALVIALRLPHVLRRLFGEGTLSMTLTADLVHGGQHADPHLPHLLTRALQTRLACILGITVLLGEVAARPLAALLAPGMALDAALMEEAAGLLRLCLPYAFTAGMAALGMARLHSLGRFLLPALTPAFFNVTVLIFALGAALAAGHGSSAPSLAAWLLACGVCCGGIVQWLAQALALRRHAPSAVALTQAAPLPPGLARRCLARLPVGIFGAAAPQLAMLGAMMAASWLPSGGVAALYYAERLLELPLGVTGAALGMVALPTLAQWAAQKEYGPFAHTASQALRLSLCVTLPAAAGLMAVSLPLVQALFARGAFDAAAVQATALALCGYAPGLPAYGCTRPLLAACHAAGHTRLPLWSGVLAVALSLTGGLTLTHLLPPDVALMGPPLGVTLGLWTQALVLYVGLNRRLRAVNAQLRLPLRNCLQQLTASAATGLGALGVVRVFSSPWLSLPLAICAGLVIYAVSLRAMGNAEWAFLQQQWKERAAPDGP